MDNQDSPSVPDDISVVPAAAAPETPKSPETPATPEAPHAAEATPSPEAVSETTRKEALPAPAPTLALSAHEAPAELGEKSDDESGEPDEAEDLSDSAEAATTAAPGTPLAVLTALAGGAKAHRLAPADEDKATIVLKELLVGGKASITSSLEPLLSLPWIISVNAVAAVWGDLSVVMRRHLLSSLAKVQTDYALRLRLSLARAIFKVDAPAGLKIAAVTVADLKDPATETLTPKHRQIFFNVFIGKGKPWLLQLPLAELKANDADQLVHCAIQSFPFCPPLSQLSILRWASVGARLKKISDNDLALAAKSVSRWNVRLQRQLRNDVPEIPEAIAAVFKPDTAPHQKGAEEAQAATFRETRDTEKETEALEAAKATETSEEPVPPSAESREAAEVAHAADSTEPSSVEAGEEAAPTARESRSGRSDRSSRNRDDRRSEKPDRSGERAERAERPERGEKTEPLSDRTERTERTERGERSDRTESDRLDRQDRQDRRDKDRTAESDRSERGRKAFDFKDSLRGLEAYIHSLRTELDQTKTQLRRKEDELKRGGGRRSEPRLDERHAADPETLARHNAQLEQTVQTLRQQLEDLASHHEAVAESRALHGDTPLPEGSDEQLKTLLSIKLSESYEAYTAMRLEPLDRVFRLDYRDLLGSVFDVLLHEGVKLTPTTPPQ